jgi:hypothetical protein
MSTTKTTAENLEQRFDDGENVLDYFDLARAQRPLRVKERINVDLPRWMIQRLDRLAGRTGVARQSLIKLWLAERLKGEEKASA